MARSLPLGSIGDPVPKLVGIPGGRDSAAGFEEFIRPHFHMLYRRAYRLTLNKADAEDLVQDVCIRAYPRFHELEKSENPRAWLMCVLYRVFIDLTRQRRASRMDETDSIDEERLGSAPGDALDPEAQADRDIAAAQIEHAWQRLDKTQRALLALHDVEGYTLAELEEITGLPPGTIKSKLHRARVRLGRMLRSEAVEAPSMVRQEYGK
jgi:RNA polymerase sigma factor (sigma-70 family)